MVYCVFSQAVHRTLPGITKVQPVGVAMQKPVTGAGNMPGVTSQVRSTATQILYPAGAAPIAAAATSTTAKKVRAGIYHQPPTDVPLPTDMPPPSSARCMVIAAPKYHGLSG